MSTTDYLKKLGYQQLCFARDKAQELIDAKNSETKKTVWQVSDGYVVHENFHGSEYIRAAEFLLEQAKKNSENSNDEKLELSKIAVFESEYEAYFE